MPYVMTHLIIADNVSKIFARNVRNMPQFILGNIAPDAVHNRANYISDYKKDSHLCVGDQEWGKITNNDDWKNNVINFLRIHKNAENRDFILGYCCHLLSDICQNVTLFMPFKQKYGDEVDKEIGDLMLMETKMIDIELALSYERKEYFGLNIENSIGIDMEGLIYASEIEKQKDYILNIWYADKERQDLSSNEIVTVEIIMNFIKRATDFIVYTLKEHLN
jgi:hypothetical protein